MADFWGTMHETAGSVVENEHGWYGWPTYDPYSVDMAAGNFSWPKEGTLLFWN